MTNIRGIDLNLLVIFDALFDERSVTRAAVRLSLTQPTVSGMLRRLRQAFSDPLFVRTSHGILPTPRAEALAGPVRDMLSNVRALVKAEAFDPASAQGTIRICASDYMQQSVVAPLIAALRARAPGLRVRVSPRPSVGVKELMERGEIDLSLSLPEVAESELPSLALFSDRYVCIARKGHPLKSRRISLAKMCSYDHLLVDPTGRSLWGPIDDALAAIGRSRRVAAAVPSFHTLFEILESDDFIAFVPERLLAKRRFSLRIFETELKTPSVEVTAYWHPRVSDDARHMWVREILLKLA